MSDEPHDPTATTAYPRPDQGRTASSRRRRVLLVLVVSAVVVVSACALVVGTGIAILYAFNPLADEWVCSPGEAPAGVGGNGDHGSACYPQGSTLPAGIAWDPFGNRPLPDNCDKDGWVAIERTATRRGAPDVVRDCVRDDTELPGRWHVARTG